MRDFTIAIASYMRRDAVTALVTALDAQVRAAPDLAPRVDVVVLVDGSDDGTVEALDALQLSVPLSVHWQENTGPSIVRQRMAALTSGDVVWFLDDDVLPAPGTFARHRLAHEEGPPRILVGPCLLPPDAETMPELRGHYDRLWSTLSDLRSIDRFDRFSAANTSLPLALLEAVGGFSTDFAGYGREDFELGHRLLQHGTRIDFDPDAVAWHHQQRDMAEFLANARSEGGNSVVMVQLHPDTADVLFGSSPRGRAHAALRRFDLTRPAQLAAVSRVAAWGAGRSSGARREQLVALAYDAAYYAGASAVDGGRDLVRRGLSLS